MYIRFLTCLLAFVGLVHLSFSQTGSLSLLGENDQFLSTVKYRFVGPYRGGRATAVTGIPQQPYTFYMGSTGGGVWKTTDAGNSWTNISDGQILCGSIGAVSVAPSNPNVVYVGTGSDSPRGNVSAGIGMYRSEDSGKTWHFIGLEKAGQIGDIIVHPSNQDLVYVAVLGNVFGPDPNRGVYRSQDGGMNWQQVFTLGDSTGAVDLAMHPQDPNVIWAGMWTVERKPWTLIDGGVHGGVYKTTDGGENWDRVKNGLPDGLVGRVAVDISPSNPERIWVIQQTAEENQGGVYRSDDGGDTFTRVNRNHKLRQRGWYYSRIFAHPSDENTVFVTNTGFYRSIDGGKTFDHSYPVPHGDNHAIWINPENPDIMINSNDGGATVTLNGGKTWSDINNQPTSEFYRLTTDNQFPFRLYAGQQDNTTISIPSRATGDVHPKQEWYSVGGGESGDVAVDPTNPNIIYSGTYSGIVTRIDRSLDHKRFVGVYPHYTEGTAQRDLKYRWQWNFPIRISAHDPDIIYHTSNFVHRSTDEGQTWEKISPDLTAALDKYHGIPGGPIQHDATGVEVYSTIFSLAESQSNPLVLWAGSDDGLIHLTKDGGRTWKDITPSNMPKEGTVNAIELSPYQDGEAYVAVYRYRRNDFKPYIFHTQDYGQSWKSLANRSNGIPQNHFVRAIAADPVRKGLLYAGTEYGMYISFDNGSNWRSFQANLPHTPITDLEVKQGSLIMSTQGRGFWMLDDLSVIRQLNDDILTSPSHLFSPSDVYRSNLGGHSVNPAPEKAPYQANLNFFISPVDSQSVTLQVLDKDSEIIRYWSTASDSSYTKLEIDTGMNLKHWDLRYPPPALVRDLVMMDMSFPGMGPKAPPGNYQVRLISNTDTMVQKFSILKDPRWKVTNNELQLNFELARQIGTLIEKSQNQIKNLRSIRQQIEDISARGQQAGYDSSITTAARDVQLKLMGLEDLIYQSNIESSQDEINYPRRFTNHIIRLYRVVIGQDSKPSGGELERWSDLLDEYEPFNEGYRVIIENDVPQFVDLLTRHNVPLIIPMRFE